MQTEENGACPRFPVSAYRGTKVAKLSEGYNNRDEKKHGWLYDCPIGTTGTRLSTASGVIRPHALTKPENAEEDTPAYGKDKIVRLKENKKETGAL